MDALLPGVVNVGKIWNAAIKDQCYNPIGYIEPDIGNIAMAETERIERRLKLHDLRVLMSVVQHGSMVKAAERLATSQPAVSRAIADLEHSFGVRLLDRGPRGIAPTLYGRALISRGITIFDELRLGVKDLEFLADPAAGEVRIGAAIAAAGFVAAVIDRLTQRHPRVVCHLMVEGAMILRALEERDVDLVITAPIVAPIKDCMQAEALYADSQFVVAAKKNPWSRRRKVRLADLMNEPWTLPPPNTSVGAAFAETFRAAGLDLPAASVVSSSGVARIALVARGRFLTIAGGAALRFTGRDMAVKALPIDLSLTHGTVGLLTLKNRTLTPVAQLFIDCAREVAKPLAAGKSISARRQQVRGVRV